MKNIFLVRVQIILQILICFGCSSGQQVPVCDCKHGNSLVWNRLLNDEIFKSIKLERKRSKLYFEKINNSLDSISRELISLSGGYHPDTLFRFINPCKVDSNSKYIFVSRRIRLMKYCDELCKVNNNRYNLIKAKKLIEISFYKYTGKSNPVFSDTYFKKYSLIGMAMDIEAIRNEFLFRCLLEKDSLK